MYYKNVPKEYLEALYVRDIIFSSCGLENRLKKLGATGIGIKELTNSLNMEKLPDNIRQKIFQCNQLRNKVAHQAYSPSAEEHKQFMLYIEEVFKYIDGILTPKQTESNIRIIVVLVIIIVAMIFWLFWNYFWIIILAFIF